MKVLFLAAEAAPFVKVGGLGDVAGALPQALLDRGLDVRVMLPRYGSIDPVKWKLHKILSSFPVQLDWRREECHLLSSEDGHTLFVENHHFFGSRDRAYGDSDDPERFVLFCRAALEACRYLNWWPDVIHAHDWHSASAVRLAWAQGPGRPGLVFTIHNIAHQGLVGNDKWALLGVWDARGNLNMMEQAIYAADVITTVSPNYAQEIRTSEFSFGLDGLLNQRAERLVGILNGIDLEVFNPATDPDLASHFSADHPEGKRACKADLQKRVGLEVDPDVPLVGVVSRLDDQKGIRLIVESLDTIVALTDAQIMVLGSGHEPYEAAFQRATAWYPGRVANFIGFNAVLARQVYAGCDIFLMPSWFEPCGLSQLIAMRYGALPVARATGGLLDTIVDRSNAEDGVGYLYGPHQAFDMQWALGRALRDYHHDKKAWGKAVRRAMRRDFSWRVSAQRYEEIYRWARSLAP